MPIYFSPVGPGGKNFSSLAQKDKTGREIRRDHLIIMVLNLSFVDVTQGKKVRESVRALECGSAVPQALRVTRNTHFEYRKPPSHRAGAILAICTGQEDQSD